MPTTTIISDDQKKNAAKVLEVFGSFRGCFQQWSNLVSVRRRTIGWNYDLEKNDPPGIPDLGLRDRLASLAEELVPNLKSFIGEPAISQGALKEIIYICESARDNELQISPAPGKYLAPAFEVLEGDLRSLSGGAGTTMEPADDPTSKVEWSYQLTKTELACRLLNNEHARPRDAEAVFEKYGLRHVKGYKHQICLEKMDPGMRYRVEHGLNPL